MSHHPRFLGGRSLTVWVAAVVAALVATAVVTPTAVTPAAAVGLSDTYSVGTKPSGIAVTADGAQAYVSNTGDFGTPGNTVTVLNLSTGDTITTLTVGDAPQSAVINPAGTKVYVANRASGTISVISMASNTVVNTITVGVGAFDIAFSPDGQRAYVSRYSDAGLIDVIDTATETTLSPITGAPSFSEGVVVSPDGLTLYATGSNDNRLFLVDLTTNSVSPTSYVVGSFPTAVGVTPDGNRVFVVNEGVANSTVSIFDAIGKSIVDSIAVGDYPVDIVVSNDGTRGYVTNDDSDTVSVLDLTTESVLTTLDGLSSPYAVAISADGRTVAVTNRLGDDVSVFTLDVTRTAGPDRYSTAVAASQQFFPSPAAVPYVLIATGSNYPDALAAGPLAANLAAPLLLTATDSLPSQVAAEVARLNPTKILVLGGEGAVSASVYSQLAGIQANIQRIEGADRYATGRAIVEFGFTTTSEVWIATGQNFPDALSAGAVGAGTGRPVVLLNGTADSVDAVTLALLTTLNPARIKIAGGASAVSAGIQAQLVSAFPSATVERFGGADRYETSLAINAQAFDVARTVFLATGATFPDALAGAPLAGQGSSPLIVVPPTCIGAETRLQIDRVQASTVLLLGGTGALNASVFDLTVC